MVKHKTDEPFTSSVMKGSYHLFLITNIFKVGVVGCLEYRGIRLLGANAVLHFVDGIRDGFQSLGKLTITLANIMKKLLLRKRFQ